MKLDQVFQHLKWQRVSGPATAEITGLALDSRQVRSGYLFVALKGSVTDGRRFIGDAIARGATAIASNEPVAGVPDSVACIVLEPSPENLAAIAHSFHGQPACRLIGVTGTNGKTTVTYFLRHLLERAGLATAIIGTVVYEFGARSIPADRTTPDLFQLYRLIHQMTEAGARAVAMEISSHALDQLRAGFLELDAAIFTNLTQDHLDYHETMEEYYQAKRKLFNRLKKTADVAVPAVVGVDDAYGRRLAEELDRAGIRATTCATAPDVRAALRAEQITLSSNGCRFDMVWLDERWPGVTLNQLGRHNVANYLCAVAAARQFGARMDDMAAAAATLPAAPGRLEFVPNNLGITIVVDYAHTDDALANVLACLRELTRGGLWVVFGCGGDRDSSKRPRMGAVAERLADHVVLTSDNPRTEEPLAIIRAIRAGMVREPEAMLTDRREAIALACRQAKPGDVVLLAGKGHETYQEINRVYHASDDRALARDIAAALEEAHVHA